MGIPKDFSIDKELLLGIAAAIRRDPSAAPYRLSVEPREHFFVLQTTTQVDVAILDNAATKVVRAMRKIDSVHLQAFPAAGRGAEQPPGAAAPQVWNGSGKQGKVEVIAVDLIVYGRRSIAHEVGRALSRLKVCLQHPEPRYVCAHVEYDNPHFLKMPGAPPLTLESLRARAELSTNQHPEKVNKAVNIDIDDLFESITSDGDITAASIDSRVKQTLLE
jgi:hypothetical protein